MSILFSHQLVITLHPVFISRTCKRSCLFSFLSCFSSFVELELPILSVDTSMPALEYWLSASPDSGNLTPCNSCHPPGPHVNLSTAIWGEIVAAVIEVANLLDFIGCQILQAFGWGVNLLMCVLFPRDHDVLSKGQSLVMARRSLSTCVCR